MGRCANSMCRYVDVPIFSEVEWKLANRLHLHICTLNWHIGTSAHLLLQQPINRHSYVVYGADGRSAGILDILMIQQIRAAYFHGCMLLYEPVIHLRINRIKR
jgi:hypothetical protein